MAFEENKHPREKNGQFAKKEGSSESDEKTLKPGEKDDYEYTKDDILEEISDNDYIYGDVESQDELENMVSKRLGIDKKEVKELMKDFDFGEYKKYIDGDEGENEGNAKEILGRIEEAESLDELDNVQQTLEEWYYEKEMINKNDFESLMDEIETAKGQLEEFEDDEIDYNELEKYDFGFNLFEQNAPEEYKDIVKKENRVKLSHQGPVYKQGDKLYIFTYDGKVKVAEK